ncbi:1-acyl-sn-glycerol-3-phosphate acyltransferase [Cohnella sp. CIP 111063]|uniref:lysophospholipid acyltransferase family protein n=1 Tax=unclassified Cohnella TaxID=2636738 RepID=UPI000B8BBC5E|nr:MULTISPECIES: lysophospholipid acyltransferase family protein [unclassified Cohnella]OXS61216.1 1-acyl-sn-glycerol-3-phosphate acyltransferase [Cohnella sp. CIP 111063]PRX73783.1 1-acyl-sn-glycerol-3-phosphate acyltransferase [Cohnella sp. SGD-V74]
MLYRIARAILRALYVLLYRLEARGIDNIPREGPVVLCSNHRSLQDPITLGVWVPRKVHYMAKEELFRIPLFGPLIRAVGAFPVKRGGVSKEAIRTAITLLQGGNVMGIFPEGTRNESVGMGKRGAVTMAVRAKAIVVPVALVGQYRIFRKMVAVYGAPIDLTPYAEQGTTESMEEATELIMSRIREMMSTGRPAS